MAARQVAELERELAQLKQQLPKHSISPSILARIDDLEEEIEAMKEKEGRRSGDDPAEE